MNKKEFEKILNKDKFQVFLFSSPVPFPFNLAVHTWFVINRKGKINRIEFGDFRGSPQPNEVGVLNNFLEPTKGMNYFWWKVNPRFNSKLVKFIEGDKNSTAEKFGKLILKIYDKYLLKNKYKIIGPNSNTFISWLIEEGNMKKEFKLPLNAIGKNYKINK